MTAVDPRFGELYEQPWWPMLRLATGLVDEVSVAEDLVQDAPLAAMSTIPNRQPEVRTLRHVAELSNADIAQATGPMTLGGQL
jgi:DNA-directed RNA polymerase specialized sigma24 family protein